MRDFENETQRCLGHLVMAPDWLAFLRAAFKAPPQVTGLLVSEAEALCKCEHTQKCICVGVKTFTY